MTNFSTQATSISDSKLIALQINAIIHKLSAFEQNPQLLAVSKKQSISDIRKAFEAGQRHFGENYLQEALEKIHTLKDLAIEWHFIGPIQSNKCKAIAENFHWVQSLDRIKVVKKLNEHCPREKQLQVCIQVNIDREQNKSGIFVENIEQFCEQLSTLNNVKLRGLMLIPKATENISDQRQSFAKLSALFKHLQNKYPEMDTLSMGMSKDYQIALEQGSTMIRLGTSLFGERKK
jgi:pyridoxal phosphate enzyme (YggS family)